MIAISSLDLVWKLLRSAVRVEHGNIVYIEGRCSWQVAFTVLGVAVTMERGAKSR